MTILGFVTVVFLIGAMLGLCFRVFILFPAVIIGAAAIIGVGFGYENSLGYILFVVFLGVTALQMGYLFGAVIGVSAAEANKQKRRSAVIESAQQWFKQPEA